MSGIEMSQKITNEMISAGIRAYRETPPLSDAILVQTIYEAMHAAWQAALSAHHSQPVSLDVEAMLATCVPGGSIVDQQVIADNIRHWFAAQPSPAGQGDELPALPYPNYPISRTGLQNNLYTASQMQDYARSALTATGKQQVGEAERERDLLAEAIHKAAVKSGIYRADLKGMTGPQLLMACDDMAECIKAQQVGEVQGDALVTDEMVSTASRAYYAASAAGSRTCMRSALEAALAARQPVGVSSDTLLALADRWASDRGYTGSPVDDIRALIDEPTPARQPVGEPVAWMTHHDEPMLFPTAAEAAAYCEDDEQPVPLFRSSPQAVDPEQLPPRWVVEFWHRFGHRDEANKLLALIDSQAVK